MRETNIYPTEEIMDEMEKQFPKGKDKARGRALVINAIALIEGHKQGYNQALIGVIGLFKNRKVFHIDKSKRDRIIERLKGMEKK